MLQHSTIMGTDNIDRLCWRLRNVLGYAGLGWCTDIFVGSFPSFLYRAYLVWCTVFSSSYLFAVGITCNQCHVLPRRPFVRRSSHFEGSLAPPVCPQYVVGVAPFAVCWRAHPVATRDVDNLDGRAWPAVARDYIVTRFCLVALSYIHFNVYGVANCQLGFMFAFTGHV